MAVEHGTAEPAGAAPAAPTSPACVDSAATEEAARAIAGACRRSVLVESSLTERSQVVAAADGTMRLQSAVSPQRVRRADGSWVPISTDLVRHGDGSVRPKATLSDVAFSGGGTAPLVTWRDGGSTFTLAWPLGPLPAPRLDGATATYESVLPDVHLHVTATAEGYSHTVEVRTPAAAANPAIRSLRYTTGGDLRVARSGGGDLRLVDGAGRTVATSAPAIMWDSSSDPARAGEVLPEVAASLASRAGRAMADGPVGEPASPVQPAVTSRAVPLKVDVVDGGLAVTPDPALMADPGLTYPIFVDPEFEKLRSKWAYATSNGENNDTTAARVGRQPPAHGSGERYRSFYDFNVSALNGKKIIAGTVRVTLDHSWSCGPTWVHIYRTGSITVSSGGRMAWATRPLPGTWLDSWEGNANEAGGCGKIQPDVDAEFTGNSLKNDLQTAANSNWTTYTVGLCACNAEGEYESAQERWKQFYTNKAWLEVTYNSVPNTPSQLSTSGQPCGGVVGTTNVVLRAYYGDADGANDSLTGFFEYQEIPNGAVVARTGQTRPGNSYGEAAVTIAPGPDGRVFQWRVRTRDSNNDYSKEWTDWCRFTLDADAPAEPGVTSGTYPDDGVARGGPGIAGSFTFTAGAPDVVRYVYGWAGQVQPLTTVTVAAGAGYTVSLTPPRHGYNTLQVYSIDGAGKQSETQAYRFLVGAASAPLAHWPLDTVAGHNLSDQIGGAHLRVEQSDVTWTPDSWLVGERTALFDGDATGTPGSATASGTGLDTSGSFSVAAWVRVPPAAACPETANRTAVSIDGAQVSGFYLSYSCATGRWRMRVPATDTANPSFADAWAPALPAGKWAHLAGAWDEAERRVSLWVNGVLTAASSGTPSADWLSARGSGWRAGGPLVVGRDRWNGGNGGMFSGEVRDVRVWGRVVTGDDLLGTETDPSAGTQARPGIVAPVEVASWDFAGGVDSGCAPALSASYWGQELELHGCTDPVSPGQTVGYTGDGRDDNGGLWFNHPQPDGHGTTGQGHAATSGPVVRTDQSLTVSAWVRLAAARPDEQVILRQGLADGALKLHVPAGGRWQFAMTSPDGAGGIRWSVAQSAAPAVLNEWVHLVGVFDAVTGVVTIHVNGVRQSTTGTGAVGRMSGDPLVVGAGNSTWGYLSGHVDQVRLFAGAMSDSEVRALYARS